MKFTLSWLREHLKTDADLDVITEKLTAIGLEVEGVSDRSAALAPFLIGHVLSAEPHPNADRLKVCEVDIGSERVAVVCGAPNVRAGMKGVFAPIGAHIPGTGIVLAEKKIRGITGRGMLCSDHELGTGNDQDGIVELPDDAPTGEPWAAWAGFDDPVIEIGLTPNRGDCASVHGIARDLAAAGLGFLTPRPAAPPCTGGHASPFRWVRDLSGKMSDACPFVAGRHFSGVANGTSPAWMCRRLEAVGLRPISALVDITNYVTLDLGRPLHVFDADRLQGNLVMRMAHKGEEISALDDNEYALDPEMTVIADDSGPIAIGGIMGGKFTGCTEETTSVFLEAALFDPVRTAATGRRLGILSDARYRFERGVDPASAEWGIDEATRLILNICGGEASDPTSAGEMPATPEAISFRPSRVASLGGVEVPETEQEAILGHLGFSTKKGKAWKVVPPSWRPDIVGEADIVEEVLRIHGFDAIPETPVSRISALPTAVQGPRALRSSRARRALALQGLEETVTFSFIPAIDAKAFGGGREDLRLDNPISPELDTMRPSILPSLLAALSANVARGERDAGLFEVGAIYRDPTPEGESLQAAVARTGARMRRHWGGQGRDVDAFDAKTDAETAVAAAGFAPDRLRVRGDAPVWYHPGRSGTLVLGKSVFAAFGEIHPSIVRKFDLPSSVAGCEVFLDVFPETKARQGGHALPSWNALMPLSRDFAFVVDRDVSAAAIVRAASGADKKHIGEVRTFDVWEGEDLGEGKKSVAIEVTIQPKEETLTEEKIAVISAAVIEAVGNACGARLRNEDG